MRVAEIATAATLMAMSVWFMVQAAALPILWESGSGPGGGAFPFWLSAIMFLCAGAILWRELKPYVDPWARRFQDRSGRNRLEEARSTRRPFIDPAARLDLALTVASLVAAVILMQWLGAYVAIPLFLSFYLKVIGRRGWGLTLAIALITPVATFFFFEGVLRILLPKGVTEPLFFPLYALIF